VASLALLIGHARDLSAQQDSAANTVDVRAKLVVSSSAHTGATAKAATAPPAVLWLKPVLPNLSKTLATGTFTLLQKDKMFSPHLLVVQVGSSVAFPNADPFFHNVFSLFDGRRFDLGLYEAGSTRSVVFSREGVSYIFCNIHSEMSAVVISLATPYYAVAGTQGIFHLKSIPEGDYELHTWIEGQRQTTLDRMTHRVHIAVSSGQSQDLGEIHADRAGTEQHLNKFGRPYDPDTHPIY